YHSPNRPENAEAAAWYRGRALLYNKKFSVYRSNRLLAPASSRSVPKIAKGRSIRARGTRRGEVRHDERDKLLLEHFLDDADERPFRRRNQQRFRHRPAAAFR